MLTDEALHLRIAGCKMGLSQQSRMLKLEFFFEDTNCIA